MIEYTVFPNAPIVEAVLDIGVELSKEVTLETLETFNAYINTRFPEKQHRMEVSAGFTIDQQSASFDKAVTNQIGYLFRSPLEQKVVQARLNGFSFNKLKPYNDWNAFCSEGRELWNIYYKIAQPTRITRIALRYINRIEMPLPVSDFKEYILTVPEVAPELPQGLAHFFMRLIIPEPISGAVAVINETMEIPEAGKILPFIFDIDVSKDTNYVDNDEDIWREFEKLRTFKNDIFFKSTTAKAKELFK